MLILRQSRKDSTLPKSSSDHDSEIARLTEKIDYLRNENRTKSCIMQTLLENDNRQQNLRYLIRVTSKYQINMCEALKITQQIIRIHLHLIDTKNYKIMMILKTRVIRGIM